MKIMKVFLLKSFAAHGITILYVYIYSYSYIASYVASYSYS